MENISIVDKIRNGLVDCNNQQLFLSTVLKGLMLRLNRSIKIRDIFIPHMIINTGDDVVWLMEKEYDYSKEPLEITNEQYIYNTLPRCIVTPQGINIMADQLSCPYTTGEFQVEYEDNLYTLCGEYRRVPLKIGVDLKYHLDTFTDLLECMQHIITKMAFIQNYNITYMGQVITCSYHIPESLEGEWQAEMDGTTNDEKNRILPVSLEVESNLPVFDHHTVSEINRITHPIDTIKIPGDETIQRDLATGKGYRGPQKR